MDRKDELVPLPARRKGKAELLQILYIHQKED